MIDTPNGTRSAWLLAALLSANNGLSTVQIQKSLFVLGERRKNLVGRDYYEFIPYNYGPFCRDVYDDADVLRLNGAIEVELAGGRSLRSFHLTPHGRQVALETVKLLPLDGVKYLADVVAWAQSLSFSELVRAVYEAFPQMKANSVFQD